MRIAIVDDEEKQASRIEEFLKAYSSEHGVTMSICIFYNAILFLDKYTADYDVVFMDIKMPYLNGLDAAHKLRELDQEVLLFFVTNMRQYAVNGYEVNAVDYIVKPVNYSEFALKITKALQRMPKKRNHTILVKTENVYVRLAPEQIIYVEVRGHYCLYHTDTQIYRMYQTMSAAEKSLADNHFVRCNNFLLLNLAYVTKVEKMTVSIHGEELQMSHPKKKTFLSSFLTYSGSDTYE